ncbi:MAG: cell envelope integrity protein TolA [Candidatus Babeliales bacterium]|jgi:hypothetical protein
MKKLVLITCLVACASVAPQADVTAAQPAAAPAAANASPCNRKKIIIYSGITAALGLALAATPWISGASWGDIFDDREGVNNSVGCWRNHKEDEASACEAELTRLNNIRSGAQYLLGLSALAIGTPLMVGLYKAIGVVKRSIHSAPVAPQQQPPVPQQPELQGDRGQNLPPQPDPAAITAENAVEKVLAWQAALHDLENTRRFAAQLNSLQNPAAPWEPALIRAQYYKTALEDQGLSEQGWTRPTPWICPQCSYKNHSQNTPLCVICLCENENADRAVQPEERKDDSPAEQPQDDPIQLEPQDQEQAQDDPSTSAEATADRTADQEAAQKEELRRQQEQERQEQENARKIEADAQARQQEELERQQQEEAAQKEREKQTLLDAEKQEREEKIEREKQEQEELCRQQEQERLARENTQKEAALKEEQRKQQQERLDKEQQDLQHEQEAAANAKPVTPHAVVVNPAPAVAVQLQEPQSQALVIANTPEAVNALVMKIVTEQMDEGVAQQQVSPELQTYFPEALKIARAAKEGILAEIQQHVPQPQVVPTVVSQAPAPQPVLIQPAPAVPAVAAAAAASPELQAVRTEIDTQADGLKKAADKVTAAGQIITKIVNEVPVPDQEAAMTYLKTSINASEDDAADMQTVFDAKAKIKQGLKR